MVIFVNAFILLIKKIKRDSFNDKIFKRKLFLTTN